MTTSATLLSLADRVEAGSGEDIGLSVEILEALDIASYITDDGDPLMSIDAAMTLVSEDEASVVGRTVFWRLGHDGEGPDASLFKATVLVVSMFTSRRFDAVSDTPARALTAACLRARAMEGGE